MILKKTKLSLGKKAPSIMKDFYQSEISKWKYLLPQKYKRINKSLDKLPHSVTMYRGQA
jgi:hypothetical protein